MFLVVVRQRWVDVIILFLFENHCLYVCCCRSRFWVVPNQLDKPTFVEYVQSFQTGQKAGTELPNEVLRAIERRLCQNFPSSEDQNYSHAHRRHSSEGVAVTKNIRDLRTLSSEPQVNQAVERDSLGGPPTKRTGASPRQVLDHSRNELQATGRTLFHRVDDDFPTHHHRPEGVRTPGGSLFQTRTEDRCETRRVGPKRKMRLKAPASDVPPREWSV